MAITAEEREAWEIQQARIKHSKRLFLTMGLAPAVVLIVCGETGFTPWWLLLPAWAVIGLYVAIPAKPFTERSPRLYALSFAGIAMLSSLGMGSLAPYEALQWMFALTSKTLASFVRNPVTWVWIACYFAGMCAGYRVRDSLAFPAHRSDD